MTVVGIDTGGTFCDLVIIDREGRAAAHKSPSTPSDNSKGVFAVLDLARNAGLDDPQSFFEKITALALGTTIATNTVVTHSGSRIGLITTRGHGDMLSIMRVNGRVAGRPLAEIQNYSITDKPEPIVPRALIVELDERIDSTGEILVALDPAQVEAAADRLAGAGVKSIAVSLLWGFLNPVHEKAIEAIIRRRHPDIFVSLGSDLSRRLGEYERTEAAVINGYVAAPVQDYLDKVSSGLKTRGFPLLPFIMQTSGGVGTEVSARGRPITTLFSGPAGGIVASKKVCEAAGFANVICADVGGTTFDVGLIVNGRAMLRSTAIIDQRVMYCSTIDVVSIGAGGGSIASVGADRRLSVGPKSAGAVPGPACYGLGGDQPTVTDANLVLGYMDPAQFLGGRLELSREAAIAAITKHVATPLGVSAEQAAIGIFSIVNAKMADLVRKVTVERGLDPRDFVLCAYGGLGPLHAPFYGQDLNVKAVLIPLGELSSVFSAYGIATADLMYVRERSMALREPFHSEDLEHAFATLEEEANGELVRDGIAQSDRQIRRFIEVRYSGQLNDVTVEAPPCINVNFDIRRKFEDLYVEAFGPGAAWKTAPIEVVGCRLEALGKREQFTPAVMPPATPIEPHARRDVYWPQAKGFVATPIYAGRDILSGAVLAGPAVVEFPTTTIVIPPGWECQTDLVGNLVLSKAPKGADR